MKASSTPSTRVSLGKGQACGGCRARKVKCSGETPVCQTCVKHWTNEGRVAHQCRFIGASPPAKAASKRRRRESSDSSTSSSAGTSSPRASYASSSRPATPPLDGTLPWLYDPFGRAFDTNPTQNLWDQLGSYQTTDATGPTFLSPLFDPTSFLAIPPPPSLTAQELLDNPVPILTLSEFDLLLAQAYQYPKVVDSGPAPLITPSFRPSYNFDESMSSLASLAAMFSSESSSGMRSGLVDEDVRVSEVAKTSVEALEGVWLNEAYFHL